MNFDYWVLELKSLDPGAPRRGRAEAVLGHLQERFGQSADLQDEVGLLWLGEEYAQLDASFCEWSRSGDQDSCEAEDLNRSAFVAWIDCRL